MGSCFEEGGVLRLLPRCREAREWLLGGSARSASAEACTAAVPTAELIRQSILFGDLSVARQIHDPAHAPLPLLNRLSAHNDTQPAAPLMPLRKEEVDAQLWEYAFLTAPLRMTRGGYMLCMHSSDQAMQHALAERLAHSLRCSPHERVLWNRKAVDMRAGIGDVHFAALGLASGKCILIRTYMLSDAPDEATLNALTATSRSSRRAVEVCVVSGRDEIAECHDVDSWARSAKVERLMSMREENTCAFCVLREEPRCICADALQRKARTLIGANDGELMGWEQYVGVTKQLLDKRALVRERIELRGVDGLVRMSRCRVKLTALQSTCDAASSSAVAKDWLRSFATYLSNAQTHPRIDVKLNGNITLYDGRGSASLSGVSLQWEAPPEPLNLGAKRIDSNCSSGSRPSIAAVENAIVGVDEGVDLKVDIAAYSQQPCARTASSVEQRSKARQAGRKRKPTRCLECSKEFSQRHHMLVHYRSVHLGEKPFACAQCERQFTQRSNLLTHVRDIHTNPEERLFQCRECDRKYKSKAKLRLHRCSASVVGNKVHTSS